MISSLSLTIEKHFCGETLIDVAIFTDTKKCSDDFTEISKSTTIKKDCCKDEVDVIEGLSEIIINSFEDLDIIQQQILFAYSYSYSQLFDDLSTRFIPYNDYLPPKLIKDIHVLDETYLI